MLFFHIMGEGEAINKVWNFPSLFLDTFPLSYIQFLSCMCYMVSNFVFQFLYKISFKISLDPLYFWLIIRNVQTTLKLYQPPAQYLPSDPRPTTALHWMFVPIIISSKWLYTQLYVGFFFLSQQLLFTLLEIILEILSLLYNLSV